MLTFCDEIFLSNYSGEAVSRYRDTEIWSQLRDLHFTFSKSY